MELRLPRRALQQPTNGSGPHSYTNGAVSLVPPGGVRSEFLFDFRQEKVPEHANSGQGNGIFRASA